MCSRIVRTYPLESRPCFLTVLVHFVHHVHEFVFCRVLAQTSHGHAELLRRDRAAAILVEQLEGLADLCNTTHMAIHDTHGYTRVHVTG